MSKLRVQWAVVYGSKVCKRFVRVVALDQSAISFARCPDCCVAECTCLQRFALLCRPTARFHRYPGAQIGCVSYCSVSVHLTPPPTTWRNVTVFSCFYAYVTATSVTLLSYVGSRVFRVLPSLPTTGKAVDFDCHTCLISRCTVSAAVTTRKSRDQAQTNQAISAEHSRRFGPLRFVGISCTRNSKTAGWTYSSTREAQTAENKAVFRISACTALT